MTTFQNRRIGHRILILLPPLALLTLLSSCAVTSCRYRNWEDDVVRDPDGVLSHARPREWGDHDDPRARALLVHGFADGPHVWKELGPALADQGLAVRALRLPGWNEPVEAKRSITRTHWREAIRTEAEAFRKPDVPLILVGHSMGACLAADLMLSGELQADALVLYAPMFAVSNARSPILTTRQWFEIGRRLLPRSFIIENAYQEQSLRGNARPAHERDPFNPKNIFVELYALMDDCGARTQEMRAPVLLVATEADRVIDTENARNWLRNLSAPVKTLRMESDAGHVLPLDLDPLAEADRLHVWLTKQGIVP